MGIDVSRGDSEDFTSICVIDFDERKQVMEYLGKIPPDLAADLAFKWGNLYKAYIVIDITGGMGVATSRKLQELGYYIKISILDTSKITSIPQHRERIYIVGFLDKNIYDQFNFDFVQKILVFIEIE